MSTPPVNCRFPNVRPYMLFDVNRFKLISKYFLIFEIYFFNHFLAQGTPSPKNRLGRRESTFSFRNSFRLPQTQSNQVRRNTTRVRGKSLYHSRKVNVRGQVGYEFRNNPSSFLCYLDESANIKFRNLCNSKLSEAERKGSTNGAVRKKETRFH